MLPLLDGDEGQGLLETLLAKRVFSVVVLGAPGVEVVLGVSRPPAPFEDGTSSISASVLTRLLRANDLVPGLVDRVLKSLDVLDELDVFHFADAKEVHRIVLTELLGEHVERILQLERLVDALVAQLPDALLKRSDRDLDRRHLTAQMSETLLERLSPEAIFERGVEMSGRVLHGAEAVLAGVNLAHDHDCVSKLFGKFRLVLDAKRVEKLGLSDAKGVRKIRANDGLGPFASVFTLDELEDRREASQKTLLILGH